MFEITGDDIALLGDEDLRTLIGRLCEAEMRRQGLGPTAVTYGGDQNAKDGGLDVRVTLPAGTTVVGSVPNPQTGFQVKKSDMPRADIISEMKPSGILRPVLLDLASASGAYIIVSSAGSTSESALKRRRNAMAEAIKGTDAEGKLTPDFYDRNRVATWVRDHAGLIPWVRSRIGKAVPGWQPYGSWSHIPEGVDATYLLDGRARIRTGDKNGANGVSALDGIKRIRELLSKPGHVVRLVGLSGVGKTRLAEALFDSDIGDDALDSSLAIYTDIADEPNPPPTGLASDLVASKARAIVIVDNCPPDLHRRLSEIARAGSNISVLTIEYDIQDDQAEGTDVFALENSSTEVIEKLVALRYSDLSTIDTHTIAEFSGGNARIALALASQIRKTETVAGLSNRELFERLFRQRNEHDPELLSVAEACSLVYSFDGVALAGDEAELPLLGRIVGRTVEELYAGVAELKRRDLVQARSHWRAILPHAIANRLAKLALQNIPLAKIQSLLVEQASGRVRRSFSRRLGYLDDSIEARTIVKAWLAPEGLLGDVVNLDELGRAMVFNVAPVAPESVLQALEHGLSSADDVTLQSCRPFVPLLRSLAYDPAFFRRSVELLVKFATLPNDGVQENEATDLVQSLFHICLSGTHAAPEVRIDVVERMLSSGEPHIRDVGIKCLEALVKTSHFSSHYDFDFGARSRDYGYSPNTDEEIAAWFAGAIELAGKFALSEGPASDGAKAVIAREFRGLWDTYDQAEALDRLVRAIASKSFWRGGWIAARETQVFDGKQLEPALQGRLKDLEAFLRPKDIVSKVRGLVVGNRADALDLDDLEDDESDPENTYEVRTARSAAIIRELGHDVAADELVILTLLPELMGANPRIAMFGGALAEAADDPLAMWSMLVQQVSLTERPGFSILCGFLEGLEKRNAILSGEVLDDALTNPVIAAEFPLLQSRVKIDEHALGRLHKALDLGHAPIGSFGNLSYGRTADNISGAEFRDLVLAIASKHDGISVALRVISTRLYFDFANKQEPLAEVREAGRLVLANFEFHRKGSSADHEDHELGVVVKASLAGPDGASVAQCLCRKFIAAATKHDVTAHDYNDLLKSLLQCHPEAILDELLSGDEPSRRRSVRILGDLSRLKNNVLDVLPETALIGWCDKDPDLRYPLAASVVTLFRRPKSGEPHQWLALTETLLRRAPDALFILKIAMRRLYPSGGWSGSLATKLEGRLKLLDSFPGGDEPAFARVIAEARASLQSSIDDERLREKERDDDRNNRFE